MIVTLNFASGQTPNLRLYNRDTDTAATSAITGTARSPRTTVYDFDIGSVAVGDYDCDIASPAGFVRLRITSTGYKFCNEWHELDYIVPTGARGRTFTIRQVTVNAPLEDAKIRLTKGAESYVLTTNASGVATASLDDGTYAVAISLFGYIFTPTTLVVAADGSTTYDLTPVSITPSNPSQTTGYWTVYDQVGNTQASAAIELRTANTPTSSTGLILEDDVRTGVSNNDGVVQFPNMFPGVSYVVNRTGSERKYTITVPANAGASVALGSIVG